MKVRLWAVSFLNARPITYGLERGLGEDHFELRFDLPARCAQALTAGEADLALLPTASYAAVPEALRVVPGIAVAGRGPVRTVLLVGEVPWEQMDRIALDAASRSSAMLLKILSHERRLSQRFEEVDHDAATGIAARRRGAMIIGDAGFVVGDRYPYVYDLGHEWTQLVGLPFVYAVWAGRPGAAGPKEVALLRESLRQGLDRRGEIARAWSQERGIEPAVCAHYLEHNIRYQLGAEELSGAAAFLHRAHARRHMAHGLVGKRDRHQVIQVPVIRAIAQVLAVTADGEGIQELAHAPQKGFI